MRFSFCKYSNFIALHMAICMMTRCFCFLLFSVGFDTFYSVCKNIKKVTRRKKFSEDINWMRKQRENCHIWGLTCRNVTGSSSHGQPNSSHRWLILQDQTEISGRCFTKIIFWSTVSSSVKETWYVTRMCKYLSTWRILKWFWPDFVIVWNSLFLKDSWKCVNDLVIALFFFLLEKQVLFYVTNWDDSFNAHNGSVRWENGIQ